MGFITVTLSHTFNPQQGLLFQEHKFLHPNLLNPEKPYPPPNLENGES
jgi:hypothetical protein